jgi:hypothetical protein
VKRTVACLTAAGALSLGTLALVPATAPANVTFHSASIQFLNQAKLQEDGTALVTLSYKCAPALVGTEGFLEVSLEQPGVAGFAFATAECDSTKHQVTLDVAPGPFTRGVATASAKVDNASDSSLAERQQVLKVQ